MFYGGGKAPAVTSPVRGRLRVARFIVGIFGQINAVGGRAERTDVNGQPGARVMAVDGRLGTVMELTIDPYGIAEVRNVLNPDKLRHLGPLFHWE